MNSRFEFFSITLLILVVSVPMQGQSADDARWDYRFAVPGVHGNVRAMVFDKKRIYLGGQMQSIGHALVGAVAEFDGKHWQGLPDGPQIDPVALNVLTMAMFKHQLYVGGYFTNAGGLPAGGLAAWDGKQWSVPGGTNGDVYALHASKQSLLVGGRFSLPGVTNPVALAHYDGRGNWEVLNSELPPCGDEALVCLEAIEQLEVLPNGDIICRLSFRAREWWGGWSGPWNWLLARCDAQGQWSNLSGPDGDPYGIGSYELGQFRGQLVAGGDFINATNPAIRNIALWDGSDWQPIGEGLDGQVFSVAGDKHRLYALHISSGTNKPTQSSISCWNGSRWAQMGTLQGDTYGRLFIGPKKQLYVAGWIAGVDDVAGPGLIRWDGKKWEPMIKGAYEGLAGSISLALSFCEHQKDVYLGGIFLSAGNQLRPGIARWNGSRWTDVGGGIEGLPPQVWTMVSSGSSLFAGGSFTNAGGSPANNLARWDGSAWHPLGDGVDDRVQTLACWNGTLYAGGRFQTASGQPTSNIAQWDGVNWHPLAEGCNGEVNVLAVWRDQLYVGGRFTLAGQTPVLRLARWDGTQWHDVGGGVDGEGRLGVLAMAAGPDGLYAGGTFQSAGGVAARSVARWDGSAWHPLGAGWPGSVYALAVRGDTLYVGGSLTNAEGKIVESLLRWDGANWSTLGSGLDQWPHDKPRVYALLARADDLWVGGRFTLAGGKPSISVARWIEHPRLRLVGKPPHSPGKRHFRVESDPGLHWQYEMSDDLRNWKPVEGDEDGALKLPLSNTDGPDARFYRAILNGSLD